MSFKWATAWVDSYLRGPAVQSRVVVLPALLSALLGFPFRESPIIIAVVAIWFVAWSIFVAWRYWIYIAEVSQEADREYDRKGKFRLSRDYHKTESATAARARKMKHG